jgi:hypothetical protein
MTVLPNTDYRNFPYTRIRELRGLNKARAPIKLTTTLTVLLWLILNKATVRTFAVFSY